MAASPYPYGAPPPSQQPAGTPLYYGAPADPYKMASAYTYAGYSPYPAAYPTDYSAGYAAAYQYPNQYAYPQASALPYQPHIPPSSAISPRPAAQATPPTAAPAPTPAAASVPPSFSAPPAKIQSTSPSAPIPFDINLPNMKIECYILHFASAQYLAVDENDITKPPYLRATPQKWQVEFIDQHLSTFRTVFLRFLSFKGNFIFRNLEATSAAVGDDERFMYCRRDDGVFSIQSSTSKFLTGEEHSGKVRCDAVMGVNSTWTIRPIEAPSTPAASLAPAAKQTIQAQATSTPSLAPSATSVPTSTPANTAAPATPAAPASTAQDSSAHPPPKPSRPPPQLPAMAAASAAALQSKEEPVDESSLSQSTLFIPLAKPQRLPVGPPADRVSAADEMIALIRSAQEEADATRKAVQLKNSPDFTLRATRLRDLSTRFRKLKKAVKAVAPAAGCVPVDLLRAGAAGFAIELTRMANAGLSSSAEFESAYKGAYTAAKSALQATEILKTNGPEVLIPERWEAATVVKAETTPAASTSPAPSQAAPTAAPAATVKLQPVSVPAPATKPAAAVTATASATVPRPPPRRAKLTPAEEQQLKAHFNEQAVIKVQKKVRYMLARSHLLKLVKEAKASKDKSIVASRQRKNVFFEIVSTEQSFGKALTALVEHYEPPMLAAKDRLMTSEEASAVSHFFGTLQGIRGLNKTLLAELEKRAAQWPAVTTMGDAFLPYIPMMKIFSIYVNDYDDFLAMTTRMFADLLASCKAKSGHTLDFEALIIMPVQRMPRYQLLIKEILKYTDQSHKDYENLSACFKALGDMNLSINTAKRERDNRMLKVRCAQSIRNLPFDLLEKPARAYVREGNLGIRKGGEVRHYHVFVFTDLAIFARQVTRASTDFALLVGFADLQIAAVDEQSFRLSGKGVDGDLIVETSNQGERDAWMKDLASYVDLIRLKEKADSSISGSANLQILRAVYGDLNAIPKDVTSQLLQIMSAQGGNGLKLRGEGRQALFGVSQAIFGDANKLQIVYTIAGGNPLSRTYSDYEDVSLP